MITLQDLEKIDSQGVHKIYDRWPDISKKSYFSDISAINLKTCSNIVFAGMGGSGTLGDIFSAILSKTNTQVTVVKGYHLPKTVNCNTLVVVTSVSGNTIEAISILENARKIGANIIAEALDHSDSQNVKVYTENTADTVQFIDKAIGSEVAPFANAFLGRIIDNLDEGERGDDNTANIPNEKNEAIGACGTNDFCVNGFESCYVCRKFRPLLDAPHEDVLESLYKEKEVVQRNIPAEDAVNALIDLIKTHGDWIEAKI